MHHKVIEIFVILTCWLLVENTSGTQIPTSNTTVTTTDTSLLTLNVSTSTTPSTQWPTSSSSSSENVTGLMTSTSHSNTSTSQPKTKIHVRPSNKRDKYPPAAFIGAALGSAVGIFLLAIVIIYFRRQYKDKKKRKRELQEHFDDVFNGVDLDDADTTHFGYEPKDSKGKYRPSGSAGEHVKLNNFKNGQSKYESVELHTPDPAEISFRPERIKTGYDNNVENVDYFETKGPQGKVTRTFSPIDL